MSDSSITERAKSWGRKASSWLPSMGTGSGDGSPEIDELIEEKERLEEKFGEQSEEVQRLKGIIEERLDERAQRAAKTTERMQELENQKQEQQETVQQLQQQLNSVTQEQEAGSVQVAAPDSEFLKEKPVFSAMGKEFFGLFDEWITSQGKVGIKAVDPHGEKPPQKVGWADSIRDLVVDATNLTHHKAVIVKLDANQERMDRMVSPRRHQEKLQKLERLEDKSQRLSSENDKLIQQKKELQDQRDKALLALNRMRLRSADDRSPARDVTMGRMSEEIDMLHDHGENVQKHLEHRNDETQRAIDRVEGNRRESIEHLSDDDVDRAFDQVEKAAERTMDTWDQIKDHLSESQQRKVLDQIEEGDIDLDIEEGG